MCYRDAIDITRPAEPFLLTFGNHNFPMWWATVIMFRKTITSGFIFDSMKMIRANWQHYRDLYGIASPTYRNDYALSIALGIVSGHTLQVDAIPWPMPSLVPSTEVKFLCHDSYEVTYRNSENKTKRMTFGGMDFHAMGKRHLETIVESSA